jgi:SAM-dependent methyltransferase
MARSFEKSQPGLAEAREKKAFWGMTSEFISQHQWDEGYRHEVLEVAPRGDLVREWLEGWVPSGAGACLELGCFPGRYLAVLGELGYELHGIDLTSRVESDLPTWLKGRGYKIGKFLRADVFHCEYSGDYQVVCSFGLIEHFANWAKLIEVHARLVRPGGLLVISTPNFRGWVQRWLHRWVDGRNLAEHNLAAMVPHEWARCVAPLGFEVLTHGYFGRVDFWVKDDPARPLLHRVVARGAKRSVPLLRFLPDGVAAYAPFCGMVARKSNGR